MGAYEYIQKTFQKEYKERTPEYKERIYLWRREPTIKRIERPTNLPRARRLGYKAKRGYVIVRVRVKKGQRRRPKPKGGRKPKHNYRIKQSALSLQVQAEQKAARRYKNLEVINSYWVGEDGIYKWYEVLLGDKNILKDLNTLKRKGRAFRGLTSAGKKSRGSKDQKKVGKG